MHLYLDPCSGASGDMILASLLSLGAPLTGLQELLGRIGIPGSAAVFRQVDRGGIRAGFLSVDSSCGACAGHAQGHHHGAQPARHLAEMLAAVAASGLGTEAAARAAGAFRLLAEAEGRVHGRPPEEVHFHEISGVDTLVDVLGTCWAVEHLGILTVTCGTPVTGRGTVACAHGVFPVPAPATLEIMTARRMPFFQGTVEAELLTPTGAALLASLSSAFGPCPAMTPVRVGYGAGSRELPGMPNVLRAVLGEAL